MSEVDVILTVATAAILLSGFGYLWVAGKRLDVHGTPADDAITDIPVKNSTQQSSPKGTTAAELESALESLKASVKNERSFPVVSPTAGDFYVLSSAVENGWTQAVKYYQLDTMSEAFGRIRSAEFPDGALRLTPDAIEALAKLGIAPDLRSQTEKEQSNEKQQRQKIWRRNVSQHASSAKER